MTTATITFLGRAVAASQDRRERESIANACRVESAQERLRTRFAEQLARILEQSISVDITIVACVGAMRGLYVGRAEIDGQKFEWRPVSEGHELRLFYRCPACAERSFHGAVISTLADIGDVVQGHLCLNQEVA